MAFNGKEGRPITLGTAKRWTKRYRDDNPGAVKAHFFGKDNILKILQESGDECMGLRIYYGIDDDGNKKLLLVGATSNQNNILPKEDGKDAPAGSIYDDTKDCPPYCPTDPNDPLSN